MGLVLSLFLGMWFVSGFVMLYTDFPGYGEARRRMDAEVLGAAGVEGQGSGNAGRTTAGGMRAGAGPFAALPAGRGPFAALRFSRLLDRTVWVGERLDGTVLAGYADRVAAGDSLGGGRRGIGRLVAGDSLGIGHLVVGDSLLVVDQPMAEAIAGRHFLGRYRPERTDALYELDQWIPRSHFLVHMPIYRIRMNDPASSWVYISSRTGEIVQLHTRRERVLAWLGPIPHWIYPRDLIVRRPLWRVVVIVVSAAGSVMCLSGIVAGIVRLRRRRKGQGVGRRRGWGTGQAVERRTGQRAGQAAGPYRSPYKKKWMRWHHYTGLLFGLFTFTWVFSGLLSMNPFRWSSEPGSEEIRVWQGGESEGTAVLPVAGEDVVEIRLVKLQGRRYYLYYTKAGSSFIRDGDRRFPYFDKELLVSGLQKLVPGAPVAEASLIRREDNYYYSKDHSQPLPVWKVRFADARQTWFYVDPATGTILNKYDKTGRMNRWLYHGFHSMDLSWLMQRRPLWDVVIISLLLGGTGVSLTGIVLTVKWIRRRTS
jgi:hypothetical protein